MPRRRLFKKPDSWEYGHDTPAHERPLAQPKRRRAATTVAFAALFFAGAAITAVAGDRYAQMTQAEDAAATDATTTTDASAPAPAADAAPTDSSASTQPAAPDASQTPAPAAPSPDPSADGTPSTGTDTSSSDSSTPATSSDPSASDSSTASSTSDSSSANAADNGIAQPQRAEATSAPSTGTGQQSSRPRPASAKHDAGQVPLHVLSFPSASAPAPAPEIEGPSSSATVWLNRALPDPTPPALRLSPKFARRLMAQAKANGIDWALALAIIRAKGGSGRVPAALGALSNLSSRLATIRKHSTGEWSTALALDGSAQFADKVQALARYNRAVGLPALVHGLEAAKKTLEQRILDDPSISIYPGGRNDIASGKVDVRVLAVIRYLHESFGEVTVSCLITGHRLYARPGVISAHIYGRAVDIAALGGTSILGHQEPGGLTEEAVRDLLLLPSEVMPKQIISLLGLGGPSFPLADHYNHIHIGF